ncbi:MAG TPA: DUF4388 domain-containing protein [Thermomicrobiales bacterium]|nr:DUF4388 domain-containing protein [Thermomicrobiales bacterium]
MREFPLAEILQFISLGSRSGILEIVRREGVYGIVFTSGTITGLTSDGWTLANELRESQLLPHNVLTGLLAVNTNIQDLRAAILTGGYMTADEWTAFVSRQVERLLYSLFDVRDGKFRFRQSAPPEGQWLPVRVSADRAVLEGTRWSEAWARAVEAIPSRQSRFVRNNRAPRSNVRLSPTQWRVIVSTGEAGTLTQVAARAILSEVDVIESLQYLLDINLVNRLETTAISAPR